MSVRKILITGSSSGIGKAIVDHLLAQGHEVWGLSRRKQQRHHPQFHPCSLDLTKVSTMRQKDFAVFDAVDAVIFSAGKGLFGHLEQLSIQHIRDTFELNTLSVIYLIKYLLPGLKKKPSADIIFIGSKAALAGSKQGSIYCATKFALRGFAQSLRLECASTQVRVAIIQPGMVRTPFFDTLSFEPEVGEMHALDPKEVAHTVQLILSTQRETIFDEIVLSPQKQSVKKTKTTHES
ncbi:MAG: SDR family oxidoreductase [Chlamydiota bacterium]